MFDYSQNHRNEEINVRGAGNGSVNGDYVREGMLDGVGKYVKKGVWEGLACTFSLFRCHVSNDTKHWYISIVPVGKKPGTNTDIDFYTSQADGEFPASSGWVAVGEGKEPCPRTEVRI